MATIVGFLGSAFGTVGGVGGGGIFVPLLNLVVGFDTKSAAALSKCTNLLLCFYPGLGLSGCTGLEIFVVSICAD